MAQIEARPDIDNKLYDEFLSVVAQQTSAVLVALRRETTTGALINLLASKSDLGTLIYSLALLSLRKSDVIIRFLATSNQAGLHFYPTKAECERQTMSHIIPDRSTANSMFFLYISEQAKNNEQLNEIIKSILKNFNDKYKEILMNDPKQLKKLKETLMNQAMQEAIYYEKKILYTACCYLLACNANPTPKDKEEMLQVFTHTAKICLNASNKDQFVISEKVEWGAALTRCTWAMSMVDTTTQGHADYLKTTPLFKYLKNTLLPKINTKLDTPPPSLSLAQPSTATPDNTVTLLLIDCPTVPPPKSTTRRKK